MTRRIKKKPALFVGICGGSASGKSRLAGYLKEGLGDSAVVVCQDWYYKDHGHLGEEDSRELNFDHPSAIETSLLLRQLGQLAKGSAVEAPIYEYVSHSRSRKTRTVEPAPVIILEGLFVLHDARLIRRLDLSVFIDVPADERLLRRVRRDVAHRRIDLDETLRLYEQYVRPMHEKFIEPTAPLATWRWRQMEDERFPKELFDEVCARLRRKKRG